MIYAMLTNFVILGVCAAITVAAVRFLVIPGIYAVCAALDLSTKTKGQIIGYATSIPELVVVVSSAWVGVFGAGFWNIASSNILNWVLLMMAVFAYGRYRELGRAKFVDELAFGVVSVAVPLALLAFDVTLTRAVAGLLLGLFVVYKVIDGVVNRAGAAQDEPTEAGPSEESSDGTRTGARKGLAFLVPGIVIVIAAGRFLGTSAGVLIETLSMPIWLVGWILGLITSIPELTSFFEIYRLSKKKGTLESSDRDTQEALDALVASNMANLGIILPVGIIVYSLVG